MSVSLARVGTYYDPRGPPPEWEEITDTDDDDTYTVARRLREVLSRTPHAYTDKQLLDFVYNAVAVSDEDGMRAVLENRLDLMPLAYGGCIKLARRVQGRRPAPAAVIRIACVRARLGRGKNEDIARQLEELMDKWTREFPRSAQR